MPGPYSPNDTLVGPIAHQIATLIATQIPSIGTVYERIPDRAPADNSVIVAFDRGHVVDDTNAKVKINLMYTVQHVFRRANLSDSFARAYTYIMPWMRFLAAWPNQTLGGLAIVVNTADVKVQRIPIAGQPEVVISTTIGVLTEFNIDLS